ncbi:carbamoyltransferase HypF [Amphritea sp. 1_MG-2023]|uniref:carbamoyltransferase HypF n=1 Tax=Amphritea sp. 1_MG-2023 TaxID=3062670 RepID=UPI0026E2A75D|nr:carbamoyltransferase HypF [Amphritea sp. 1_MG-2023]MDO6563816.1 carbamoyltransferase HypF [Amphritea sp. 1_MG-2023]
MRVSGQVQGVGFRPFVYNLARRLELAGTVANSAYGVDIWLEGEARQLMQFQRLLALEAPPMALIEQLKSEAVTPQGYTDFSISQTQQGVLTVGATPDAAVCRDCLHELFDITNRRYHYPFINCTHCGPRYSIIRALPYDRQSTTMADFRLCDACEAEYCSPNDRRFHAQPNACAQCGPQLSFADASGQLQADDPLSAAARLIEQGLIVAVKGIGGFHLLCDARNPAAIERLRQRKSRPVKPFAVLGLNPPSLAAIVQLNEAREQRLQAQDAPIVLCPATSKLSAGIAPGLAWCGVMLPHTPIHYLLLHRLCAEPQGQAWLTQAQPPLLIMTSANRRGNPLITDNQQAMVELQGIADGFVLHNRNIHTRCDDSVVHGLSDDMPLIRRGRGLAPQVIRLPQSGPSTLAVGAFFKNTLCITQGDRAYVSQYIGDLDNPDCCQALATLAQHLMQLLEITPQQVVCDLHPDFYSSRFARQYAQQQGIPLFTVQHHHAHLAAVMAEHRVCEPVLGLALDGFGLGVDHQLWGGELLRIDGHQYTRLGHLPEQHLPGGDRAASEPWRSAAAVLYQLQRTEEITQRFHQPAAVTVTQMLQRQFNCPLTSSAGRLFDAVASLLGICHDNSFEADAAMQLEARAYRYLQNHPWPELPPLIDFTAAGEPLLLRLLATLADAQDAGWGAALFHRQLIDGLTHWMIRHQPETRLPVVLAGGCFLNQLLRQGLTEQLQQAGLTVYSAKLLPCNDAGISLGQAQIAQLLANSNNNEQRVAKGLFQCV